MMEMPCSLIFPKNLCRNYKYRKMRRLDFFWVSLNTNPFFKAVQDCIGCQLIKAFHNIGPDYLKHLFTWYTQSRNIQSNTAKLVVILEQRESPGGCFIAGTAKLWNSLPITLKHSPSLWSFRKALKTWLFSI